MNYIQYQTMYKTVNDNSKIVVFMSLNTAKSHRNICILNCDSISLDHFGKNNNTLWLHNNDKLINHFDLTDYEVKHIKDKINVINHRDLSIKIKKD